MLHRTASFKSIEVFGLERSVFIFLFLSVLTVKRFPLLTHLAENPQTGANGASWSFVLNVCAGTFLSPFRTYMPSFV